MHDRKVLRLARETRAHHMREFVLIHNLHIVQLDVHVLIHRMQGARDGKVILQLDSHLQCCCRAFPSNDASVLSAQTAAVPCVQLAAPLRPPLRL